MDRAGSSHRHPSRDLNESLDGAPSGVSESGEISRNILKAETVSNPNIRVDIACSNEVDDLAKILWKGIPAGKEGQLPPMKDRSVWE